MSFRISFSDRILLGLAVAILLFFLLAPMLLSGEGFQTAFAEGGFFELLSVYGWLSGVALIFVRVRPIGWRAVSFAALSLAMAAREADWQKKFTSDGVLKINYYQDGSIPLLERLIAGLVVLLLVAGLLYAVYAALRFLFFEGGWAERSGVWLFATGVSLVLGKSLDRIPGELNQLFGITLGEPWVIHLQALEEGIEALAPLFFLWSVWLSGAGRSFLARRRSS